MTHDGKPSLLPLQLSSLDGVQVGPALTPSTIYTQHSKLLKSDTYLPITSLVEGELRWIKVKRLLYFSLLMSFAIFMTVTAQFLIFNNIFTPARRGYVYSLDFYFIISLTLGLNGQTSFEYSTTNYVDPAFNTPPDSWKYVPTCEGPRIGSK